VIARLDAAYASADLFDYGAAFMSEDSREQAFGIFAGQGERVRMANAAGDDPQQDFTLFGRIDFDGFDRQWLSGLPGDGCS